MRPFNKREVMITPTPMDYPSSEFFKGLVGPIDYRTAGKWGGLTGAGTVWYAEVTGTSCYIRSDSGNGSNRLYASLDDGTPIPCNYSNDRFIIFENLPYKTYRVLVSVSPGGAGPFYKTNLSNALTVHGFPAIVNYPTTWTFPGDGNPLTSYSSSMANMASGYTPSVLPVYTYNVSGSSVVSMKIKCSASKMVVHCISSVLCVSTDGAQPKVYYNTNQPSGNVMRSYVIPLDGQMHTYYVWQDVTRGFVSGAYSPFMIGVDAALVDCGTKRRLDQFGSSSTAGAGALAALVDTMITAAALGMTGSTYGISGENLAGFTLRVDACLAQKTVSASDISVLQLGANDIGTAWNATQIANYTYCINAMLAKGYGKIFCRGLPTYNGLTRILENNSIIAIVNAVNNPKVVYVNADTWLGVVVLSDVHPTTAGYITLANYATAAYAPLI